MPTAIDLTNQKFGQLVAIRVVETGRRRKWLCRCDCGTELVVGAANLRSGNSQSCGGHRQPTRGAFKHGHSPQGQRSPTYRSWKAMRNRCRDTGRENAKHYALSGISCDPAWDCFETFLTDMGERPVGRTLDRLDNTRGYSRDNCRWSTPTEQTRNRRTARAFTHEGRTLSVAEWAEELGITYASAIWHVTKHGRLPLGARRKWQKS